MERDTSKGLVRMLDIAHDAKAALGDLWVEVEVFARRAGITEGEALGQLAAAGLKKK